VQSCLAQRRLAVENGAGGVGAAQSCEHPRLAPLTMTRKKNAIPIRCHYSRDLKERVLYQRYQLGKKTADIAVDLDMPLRVVQRILQTFSEIGRVCRERKSIGRAPLLQGHAAAVSL
jgi:hypothetical protein